MYFPQLFSRDEEYQFYQQIKLKIICLAELAEAEEDKIPEILEKIKVIDAFFLNLQLPNSFSDDDSKNVVLQYERQFEAATSALMIGGFAGVDRGTTFEYYSRIEYLKSTQKQNK